METDNGNPRLRTFMVECYAPGIHAVEVAADGDRAQAAAEAMRRGGRRIEYVRGLLLPLDEVVFHFRLGASGMRKRRRGERMRIAFEISIDRATPGRLLGRLGVSWAHRLRRGDPPDGTKT